MEKASIIFGEDRDLAEDKSSWRPVATLKRSEPYDIYGDEDLKGVTWLEFYKSLVFDAGVKKASEVMNRIGISVQPQDEHLMVTEKTGELVSKLKKLNPNVELILNVELLCGAIQKRQTGASLVIPDEPEEQS